MKTHERVKFRLIHTPCCGTLLCWVNPRLPNFCPECGVQIYGKLHTDPTSVLVTDMNAELVLEDSKVPILPLVAPEKSAEERIKEAVAYINKYGEDPSGTIEHILTGQ